MATIRKPHHIGGNHIVATFLASYLFVFCLVLVIYHLTFVSIMEM